MRRIVAVLLAWCVLGASVSGAFAEGVPRGSYYFLIDNSGSMAGQGSSSHGNVLPALRKTLAEFVHKLPDGVEVRAWRFSERTDVIARQTIHTEADRTRFLATLNKSLTAKGDNTFLYSSIANLLAFMKKQKGPTPTLLVFTDGADTEGRLTFDDVVGAAEDAQVARKDLNLFVYTLGFKSPDMATKGPVKVTTVPDPTVPFKVTVDAPVAAIDASPRRAYVDTEVLFLRPPEAGGGPIDSYQWDFGDGTTSDLPRPRHRYTKAGSYTVSLTVAGPGGKDTHREVDFITIEAKPAPAPPKAAFDVRPMPARPNEEAFFRDLSTGLVDHYLWDFGDGATSTDRSPSHRYSHSGRYHVSFHVEGPGGAAESSQEISVEAALVTPKVSVVAPVVAGGWLTIRVGLGDEPVAALTCRVKHEGGLLSSIRSGSEVQLADDGNPTSGDEIAGDNSYTGRWRTAALGRYRVELTGRAQSGVALRGEGRAKVYVAFEDDAVDLGRRTPGRGVAEVAVRNLAEGPVTARILAAEDGPAAVVPVADEVTISPGRSHISIPVAFGVGGATGPFHMEVPIVVAGVGDDVAAQATVTLDGTSITVASLWLRRGAWAAAALLALLVAWAFLVRIARPGAPRWRVQGPTKSVLLSAALRRKGRTLGGLLSPSLRLSLGGPGSDIPVLSAKGVMAYLRPTRRGLILEGAASGLEKELGGGHWAPVGAGPLPITAGLHMRVTGLPQEEIEITQ